MHNRGVLGGNSRYSFFIAASPCAVSRSQFSSGINHLKKNQGLSLVLWKAHVRGWCIMDKITIFILILLALAFVLVGISDSVFKTLKVDYIDIGLGEDFYEGKGKISTKNAISLMKAYQDIEFSETTTDEIDYESAITITFINNDQIKGYIIIDENGLFESDYINRKYGDGQRGVVEKDHFYKLALKNYEEIKAQYK